MRTEQARGLTMAFNSGALANPDGATTYNIATAVNYAIDGIAYSKGTVSGGTTPTTDINTGAAFIALSTDQTCAFVWMVNASGTVAVAQGPVVDVDGDTDLRKHAVPLPPIPDGYCPIGITTIQTAGTSSAWTFGSSNWNATGVTKLIQNVSSLPARPVTGTVA